MRLMHTLLAGVAATMVLGAIGCSHDDHHDHDRVRSSDNFRDRDHDGIRDGMEDRNRDGVRDGNQNGGPNYHRDPDIYR